MDIESYLHFTQEASVALRGLIFFAGTALIPFSTFTATPCMTRALADGGGFPGRLP